MTSCLIKPNYQIRIRNARLAVSTRLTSYFTLQILLERNFDNTLFDTRGQNTTHTLTYLEPQTNDAS
jgi:hypothetical protein